ncbi:hypothetical protein FRC00_010048 [Tulasnella sp. 408]|nr:hypothetical protein FRC00_010048 [Tulasnella sp. 408]
MPALLQPLMDSSNSPTTHQHRLNSKGKGKAVPFATTVSPSRSSSAHTEIPDPVFLLGLPALLLHPPDHPNHVPSLRASLDALNKCLSMHSSLGGNGSGALSFEQEMQAYGMQAEIGLKVVSAGLTGQDGPEWARGIESEIEDAIGQGTRLCQQIASLRPFRSRFSILRAHLLLLQNQVKACRAMLKREINTLNAADSSSTVYTCYFTYINALLSSTPTQSPDYSGALSTLQKVQSIAHSRGDKQITTLALATRLQVLMRAELWELVGETCESVEEALGFTFEEQDGQRDTQQTDGGTNQSVSVIMPTESQESTSSSSATDPTPLFLCMKIHVLMLSILYHTRISNSKLASARLGALHDVLDSDALENFPSGVLQVTLTAGPPFHLNVTHPRILYELAFLVSGVCKRDVVGRKPKRKIFVKEGLGVCEEVEKLVTMSLLGGIRDMQKVEERLNKIRADGLCEMVSICVMRSEFDEAEASLSSLIAHTRSTNLFQAYAPQITLLSAYLCHALGQTSRALDCYRSAAYVDRSSEKGFVRLAARVGEVILRIGQGEEENEEEVQEMTVQVIKECKAHGAQFEAVGRILEAILAREIIEIKKSLKSALEQVTRSLDNHLRALILALMANMYLLTASDHAQLMLKTCQQLASGLGAPEDKANELVNGGSVVGNVPLGLWVGEKFLELYRRAGKESKAQRQAELNAGIQGAMDRILQRSEKETTEDVSGETTVEDCLPSDGMEVDGGNEGQSDEDEFDRMDESK